MNLPEPVAVGDGLNALAVALGALALEGVVAEGQVNGDDDDDGEANDDPHRDYT